MEELLSKLVKRGVRFNAIKDELKIQLGNTSLSPVEKESLKANKQEILSFLNESKLACLSFQQERLWFLDQLGYGFQYHVPGLGMIKGDLDFEALEQALNYVVARHESLRTTFTDINGTACQLVRPFSRIPISKENIGDVPPEEKELKKKKLLQDFFEVPFNLESGPLFRILLIRIGDQSHILGLSMHHIITDGWSMKVLLKDLSYAYSCIINGENPLQDQLKLQYSGYAAWQKEVLTDEKLEKELFYWKKQLSGYRDLDMPLDFIRSANSSGKGDYIRFSLDQSLGILMRKIAKEKRMTPFAIFIGAVYFLLSRYSHQKDICLGMPVANRGHRDLEDLIGFFVNTIVLRINTDDNEPLTVNGLLQLIQQTIIDGQDHQNLPIEKVLEFLQPERDLGKSPIFQVLINYTPVSFGGLKLGSCSLEPSFEIESLTSKFDLTFTYNDFDDGLGEVFIEFSTDLYQKETIERMADQLSRLIQTFVHSLDSPLSDIHLITLKERQRVIYDWNQTQTEFPLDKCIHELFEQQALKTPNNIAVIFKNQQFTYQQLNEASTNLAVYIQEINISCGNLVGICLERSWEMIVTVLAILKSGNGYVPLDVRYPKERLQFMIEDAELGLVLTDKNGLRTLHDCIHEGRTQIIAMDDLITEGLEPKLTFKTTSSSESLAYLMYTSGTTGKPKGVMLSHKNVVNHNLSVLKTYGLTPQDRVLQFSSISFDIFVEEVFPTLYSGASLVLMESEYFMDVNYLKPLVSSKGVTVLNLPTAYWHTLAEEDFSNTNLRLVIIGGEKAGLEYYKRWHAVNPAVEVINTYGPTETTVISLLHKIHREDNSNRPIPLGKPIDNTQVYVLDEAMHPVPIGVLGELYIGGAGVAKGYLNREVATLERFVPHPFDEGKRLFRTGDLVKWRSDGNLEFGGRKDQQVKIRGYRVELGEITNAILAYEGIKEAAVIAKLVDGSKQLIGFYSSSPNSKIEASDLDAYLKKKLPSYMVPSFFKYLDNIPLTPNGKIDTQQLEKEIVSSSITKDFQAPETIVQIQLAAIWKSLLNVNSVGLQDNFFHLGGHSLKAIQVVREIERQFGIKVPLTVLFELPMLEPLSNWIENHLGQGNEEIHIQDKKAVSAHCLVPLRIDSGQDLHIIVPGMPGLVNGYQELANSIPASGNVYGLELPGCTEGDPMTSIYDIAKHHIELIKTINNGAPIHFYAHSFGGTVVYEILKQLRKQGDMVVGKIVLIDCFRLYQTQLETNESKKMFCIGFFNCIGLHVQAEEISAVLSQSSSLDWEKNIIQKVAGFIRIDIQVIERLWEVVKTSMTMSYSYDESLPWESTLVIAEGNQVGSNQSLWRQCFSNLDVIQSDSDHFSIVKKPFCNEWLPFLFSIKQTNSTP